MKTLLDRAVFVYSYFVSFDLILFIFIIFLFYYLSLLSFFLSFFLRKAVMMAWIFDFDQLSSTSDLLPTSFLSERSFRLGDC